MYIDEYMQEVYDEYEKYLREHQITDPDDMWILTESPPIQKDGVFKENYYFRDHLQIPYISKKLESQVTRDKVVEFVGTFLDNNREALEAAGPTMKIRLTIEDAQPLMDIFGITGDQIITMFNEMVKETYYGKISKMFVSWSKNSPHKIFTTAMLIEGLQKGYEDIVECCEYIWGIIDYSPLFKKYFQLGVQKPLMDYTIEHLSTKFKVKHVSNLRGLLKYDAHSAISYWTNTLMTGADSPYMDLMYRVRNQLKNTIENIAKAYYDNQKNNATIHTRDSQFDDGSVIDQEGINSNLAQAIDYTANKFASGSVNTSIAKICAEPYQLDKDNLIGYLNQIFTAKGNNLYKMLESIITVYFNKNPASQSLGTSEFVNYGLSLFRSIATSKDPMMNDIRQILNYWMFNIINIRQFYNREATISSYTRAIFNYVIFMINSYNN